MMPIGKSHRFVSVGSCIQTLVSTVGNQLRIWMLANDYWEAFGSTLALTTKTTILVPNWRQARIGSVSCFLRRDSVKFSMKNLRAGKRVFCQRIQ